MAREITESGIKMDVIVRLTPGAAKVSPEAQSIPSEASAVPPEEQLDAIESPVAPSAGQPEPSASPTEPEEPLPTSLWLIIGMVAVGIIIGIVIWRSLVSGKSS